MKRYFPFIIIMLLVASCTVKDSGYKITGKASGFTDSTLLYLDDATRSEDVKTLDSTYIVSGTFTFTGKLADRAKNVIIRTADNSDSKYFWIENSDLTFTGEKGKFRSAVITGSKTQQEDEALDALVSPIYRERDSLNNLYRGATKAEQLNISKQMDIVSTKELTLDAEFMKAHPASYISVSMLNIYASTYGKGKTDSLYNGFTAETKKTAYGKNIAEYLRLNKDIKIGDKYADFTQTTPTGQKITVSQFAGKVFLIDFWASWCGPCRQENPELAKSYQQYKNKGFEVIGVSLDRLSEKQDWIDAIKKDKLTWANVSELNGDRNTAALMYGINGIPDNFLVNKQGIIVARNLRGQELRDKLKELLP